MRKNTGYKFKDYVLDVWHYIIPYKKSFFIGFLLRFTSDIAHLYPAWAVIQIVLVLSENPGPSEAAASLSGLFMLWAITGIYYGVTHNLSKYFGFQVAEKAALDIYKESLSHIFKLDISWQEKEDSGNKMKRLDRGFDGMKITIRRIFNIVIEVVVNIVGIVIIFTTLDFRISLSLVFFITTYVALGTHFLKRAIFQEKVVSKAYENLGGITFESLNNVQTIKSLGIDRGVVHLVGRHVSMLVDKVKKRIYYYQSQHGILLIYQILFGFFVTMALARGVVHGIYEVSLLILFIGLFQRVTTSANELTEVVQELSSAKVWLSRVRSVLNTQPRIEDPEIIRKQTEYPQNWKQIKIENLNFAYKSVPNLENVSFNILRGEKVGIVGLSGAGKSTLFKLMLDLYESYKGKITIDGVPLKRIIRQSYIDHVAVVLQDTELFNMSLSDNIRIAAVRQKKADKQLLSRVITMAHLDDVVAFLPKGGDTIVGEKGIKLSGGQRQRVGIARALYREPDILLLDEATSHLDAHSEKEIQRALEGFLHKYTTIVIAHRLSTIKAMDKIIVLENGRVAEVGNFEDLIKRDGVFSAMWQEQKI